MNKVICRCNKEFETIAELLEHYETEHSTRGIARRAMGNEALQQKIRRVKMKPVMIRLGPTYYELENKQNPEDRETTPAEFIPNDL